jgi:hypothetical protein
MTEFEANLWSQVYSRVLSSLTTRVGNATNLDYWSGEARKAADLAVTNFRASSVTSGESSAS